MKNKLVISLCAAMMIFSLVGCKSINKETTTTEVTTEVTTAEDTTVEDTTETPVANGKVKAPDITGEVKEISEDGKQILIDSTNTTVNGLIWVTITEETSFFENAENAALAYHNVSREFEVGNHVEVIIDGPVLESAPMQATATAVAVNEK